MKPNTKHLFVLIGMVTLLLSIPAVVKSQDGTWDASRAGQLDSEMQNAYNTFLQLVDQGQADTPAGQQAFAAYDSARIRFCDYVATAPRIAKLDAASLEAWKAWEEHKRLRAQGKTDEVGPPRNASISGLMGDVDPIENTYGAFCLTTPPPGYYEQGVEITIRVEAEGYEPTGTTLHTQDYEPSSIQIYGLVTDKDGKPIPGATVTLAAPSKTETTDASGSYQLYVETVGTKPYADKLDWVLETKVSAVNIDFKPPEIIPIPGEVPLSITVTDQDGLPLKKATAIITLVDGHKMPFLTIENDQAWLDEKGQFSTKLTTRDPAGMDYVYLTDIPLEATISVEIKDKEESSTLGQIDIKRPFNLALIHGVTVGPDMEPRAEEFAPELVPDRPDMSKLVDIAKELLFDQEKNDRGDFWVLVRPYYPRTMQPPPKGVWHLKWSMFDHLPLHYPLPNPPVPGKVLELGKIDVLTPEEHEARLTQIVGEFLIAMPLKPGARQGVWDNLYALTFAVDASKDVPFYRDNALDSSGTIYYPDKPENYWGQNPQKGNDPAYVIISHELGHFLHHALIERHGYRHFCYKFGVGLGHNTWQPPDLTIKNVDLAPMAAKEYTSFSESNADFFASLLIPFWLKHHPEMAESIYLQDLGYLAEFDTDEKAMDVVSAGIPGFIVEGVQTRFLRAIYARYLADRPEWAYADYLATMWLYMEKPEHWTPSFLTRPARTISQWAQTKARLGSPISLTTTFAFAAGNSTLVLAEKYKVLKPPEPSPVGTYPVVLPLDTDVRPVVRIGSQTVDFANWDLPAAKANVGEEIEVERGAVALAPSGDRDGGTVVLKEKAKVILRDLATVEVQRGVVAIEGPVKAQTRNATVKPSGTVYVVEVTDSGETVVSTFDGEVVAESNMGSSRTLGTGEQVEITAQGAMGETTTFDVSAATKDLLSAPEMPFDLQALSEYEETLGPGETVLDTQEPTISNLRPADGAIVRIDPTISADYADNPGGSGIDTDAVTIMVDGVDRTAEATVTGSNISFEPGKLAKGPHEVTVVIIDRDGNSASVSWWFEVQRGTGILPYGLGIAAALLMGIGALGVLFSRGGLEPALAPLASQAIAIRQQVRAGGLHPSQVRALTGQDRQGRRWSLDPLQERWQLWTGAAWRPARPPLARRWGCIVGGLSALGLGGLLGLLVVGLLISEGLPQTPSIARATATALRQYVPTATSMSAPPPSVITPTPQAGLLPDLVIARARVTMRGYTGGCVTEFAPLVTEVCVENRGAAAAGPFVIQAGDGAQWPVEGLTAGEQRCLKSESDVSGQMVTVDAGETVAESDETNNTLIVPIPTPPAICTPLPTLTPEATSLPTEAEFVRILAVEAPDQVSAGELFVVTIRYAWSFRDEGTVGIRAEGGGGYRGQPGSPTEVTGEGEFTHSLPVLAPDTPAPHTFMVEAYGYSATSPDLTDQREMMVSVIAPGGQAELDAETALAILPSAAELGVDRLEFADFIMPDEGAGFGALPVFRSSSQDTVVDLMVFASADDAGRFTNQTFSDYQSMGSPPTWTDLGDESFARQDEVLVRVDRYILWALGGMSPDQLRPSVQRLQTFVGGGP